MKTKMLALALAPALLLASGCSFLHSTAPDAAIPFARADYKLKGQTAAKECGTYIFGINWGALFSDETASTRGLGGGFFGALFGGGAGTREEQAAFWDALKKMPGATHVMKSQVRNTFSGFGTVGFPLFGKRCAEVVAHAVHMGQPYAGGSSRGGVGENVSQWPVAGSGEAPPAEEGKAAVEEAGSDEGTPASADDEEDEEE